MVGKKSGRALLREEGKSTLKHPHINFIDSKISSVNVEPNHGRQHGSQTRR